MPIYAYKCGSCGYAKDVLQKMSDAALTQCPACNAQAFSKQLTAPDFQLKGTGWYATDFKNGSKPAPAAAPAAADPAAAAAPAVTAAAADAGAAPAAPAATPAASAGMAA